MSNKIVVIGARAAGLACAISAAPCCAAITLVEKTVSFYNNITVLRNACPTRIQTQGCRVRQIEVEIGDEKRWLPTDALVDTTGSADVVRMLDPHKLTEGEALAGLIFQLRSVASDALTFPKNVAMPRSVEKAVNEGKSFFKRFGKGGNLEFITRFVLGDRSLTTKFTLFEQIPVGIGAAVDHLILAFQ